jgi:hypothetical protein
MSSHAVENSDSYVGRAACSGPAGARIGHVVASGAACALVSLIGVRCEDDRGSAKVLVGPVGGYRSGRSHGHHWLTRRLPHGGRGHHHKGKHNGEEAH